VAYPVPTPEMTEEEFEQFLERLGNFSLTIEQREFWRESIRKNRKG